nr:MAG TPA: tail completion protein [Caudoviricetes sp.]
MINSIIESISITLDEEFGDEYEIHMEEIKQGLNEPCFFINCLNPKIEQFLGKRYFHTNQFCIQYFPATVEKQRECNEVAERMIWALEYIRVDSEEPVRGTDMHYEIIDGVLNFFINYDCFIYRAGEEETMEMMDATTNVEEGDEDGNEE